MCECRGRQDVGSDRGVGIRTSLYIKIHGATLLEASAAEQHFVRQVLQAAAVHHPLQVRQYVLAGLAMDHAVQVEAPLRQVARTAVTERDEIEFSETASQLAHLRIRHVPHHHGVGAVADLMMPHHHTETANHTAGLKLLQAGHDLGLAQAQTRANLRERARYQRQAALDSRQQPPVRIIQAWRRIRC